MDQGRQKLMDKGRISRDSIKIQKLFKSENKNRCSTAP